MGTITRNRIKCLACGIILESKHRHDFQMCPGKDGKGCPNQTFLDGGLVYCRIGGIDTSLIGEVKENE